MIRTIIDLFNVGFATSSFLVALLIWTALAIIFAKTIKKNANVFYWVFGVMGVVYALPMLLDLFDIELPFSVSSIPVLNVIIRELSSAAYFIHPVIVIIMYMGALKTKSPYVAKLMSIRKELSIIVGFAVIAHATKRVLYTFPRSWNYFVDNDAYMADSEVVSVVGATISNFVLFLGIFMTVLFLVLWITSFDTVRLKMGGVKWKKVQKWSYALYAMLFIHAVGLQLGSLVTGYARERIEQTQSALAVTAAATTTTAHHHAVSMVGTSPHHHADTSAVVTDSVATSSVAKIVEPAKVEESRPKRFYLRDVEVSRRFRAYFNISLYVLIYGSYLYLRTRKARRDKLRRRVKKS